MCRPWPITFGNKESLSIRYVSIHWPFVAADESESESLSICVVGVNECDLDKHRADDQRDI